MLMLMMLLLLLLLLLMLMLLLMLLLLFYHFFIVLLMLFDGVLYHQDIDLCDTNIAFFAFGLVFENSNILCFIPIFCC